MLPDQRKTARMCDTRSRRLVDEDYFPISSHALSKKLSS